MAEPRSAAFGAQVAAGSPDAAATAISVPSATADPLPYVFPVYSGAAEVDSACAALVADLKRREAALALPAAAAGGIGGTGSRAILAALDAMRLRAADTMGPLGVSIAVHPDKAVRDAAERCDLAVDAFDAEFRQNTIVHALLTRLQPADDIDRAYLRRELEQFEDAGVALAPAARERARAIDAEISRQAQAFDRRLREDRSRVAFGADELRGVPESVWQRAPRDAEGRYLLGLDYPTAGPVLQRADSEAARERMWRAFNARGGEANLATLVELGRLRREYARLFGLDSWDDYVLRRRMAGSAAEVRGFLDEVRTAVAARERADLEVLQAAKAEHLRALAGSTGSAAPTAQGGAARVSSVAVATHAVGGAAAAAERPSSAGRQPATPPLQRWDVGYYTERVRQARHAVDQEQFRAYFPPQASVDFVFALAARLFGVRFKAVPQALWHADARAYLVRDTASGRPIGTLFTDLYPRDDKYGHAAVWSFRAGSRLAGRSPAAALVVNFNRRGLTLAELETLLHEFGHALHTLLSETRYAGNAGTRVRRDFVEAPSQMLEDWVYDPAVLALLPQVCPACVPVPPGLIGRADRARHFAKGLQVARQQLLAAYDLAFYSAAPADPLALWTSMEEATPLGHVAGSLFPAGFGHIAGGYAAGYYGYLWSLAVADDLRTAFTTAAGAPDRLNAVTGLRWRQTVLARGGEVEPAELVRRFLGRPTDRRAFFEELDRR